MNSFNKFFSSFSKLSSNLESSLLLQAKTIAQHNNSLTSINSLSDVEFSVFSQWGEDGIISWLTHVIPNIPPFFVEFGVQNYEESNTRYLLLDKNWSGLVLDSDLAFINHIKRQNYYWRHTLSAVASFVTVENITPLLLQHCPSTEIGLLSIDIDGNDYWIWKSLSKIRASIIVIEYNATFGDKYPLSIPYQSNFSRGLAHYSNLYFGSSLTALVQLGNEKGYTFLGTNSNGCNAFFVRNDLFHYLAPSIRHFTSFPSKFRESRDLKGKLSYLSPPSRLELISDCSVIDCSNGRLAPLSEFGSLYSSNWAAGLPSFIPTDN
jgi:hypothetical protein